jgi:putative membrane protein
MFHDGFMGGMWFGWIFWIVIIAIIVWAILRFTQKPTYSNSHKQVDKSPLDILKERYAKGEITKEDFDKMKNDLE